MSRLPGPLTVRPISLRLSATVWKQIQVVSSLSILLSFFSLRSFHFLFLYHTHPLSLLSPHPLPFIFITLLIHYTHNQDTLSSLTIGRVDLALGGRLWEGTWLAKGPREGGTAWTPGLQGPSTSLRFLLLEKCLKETGYLVQLK